MYSTCAHHVACTCILHTRTLLYYLLLPIPFNTQQEVVPPQQEVSPPPYDHWAIPPNQRPLYLDYELLKQMLDVALITHNFEPTVKVLDMFFSSPSCINGSFLNRYCTGFIVHVFVFFIAHVYMYIHVRVHGMLKGTSLV